MFIKVPLFQETSPAPQKSWWCVWGPQGSIGPILILLYINHPPEDVFCNITIYADDTTLYSKHDRAFDLWQKLELASELEFDLKDTVDSGRK